MLAGKACVIGLLSLSQNENQSMYLQARANRLKLGELPTFVSMLA